MIAQRVQPGSDRPHANVHSALDLATEASTFFHMVVGTVDWQQLTDGQCWEAIRSAPKVYGPWTRAGDSDNAFVRPSPNGSPSLVMVKRIMGTWYGYIGKSISLPSGYATREHAMDLVDKLLRLEGVRLVGDSHPVPKPVAPRSRRDTPERTTTPSVPRALRSAMTNPVELD